MTKDLADGLGVSPSRLVPIWDDEAHPRMIGPMEASLRRVACALDLDPDESLIVRELSARTAFHAACLASPRPEAAPTLEELRRRGFKIGVISNCTSDVPPAWPPPPLAGLVDAAVFSSRVGLTKPDPAIYAIALERLGVEAAECLYVGDGAGGRAQWCPVDRNASRPPPLPRDSRTETLEWRGDHDAR
jgi:putative hydrolase of the HAD superfamily